MDKKGKVILVTGATGQQGGAAARHLLKDGWAVRAFVRDENKDASKELKNLGAEILKGDMSDVNSLNSAMKGVYGVFSVQNFWEHGYEGELSQGKNVIDAAHKEGVKHFLYSSVGSANMNTKLPHFEVKFELEKYLKASGMPYTIIRPVFFFENFNSWFKPAEAEGKFVLNMAMKADTKLQMIATDDIGGIATLIFDDPEKYLGKEIEIAGDELSLKQMADAFSKNSGKEVTYFEVPVDAVRANSAEVADMFQWFMDKGYDADINGLREIYPGLTSMSQWLQKSNYKI